MHKNVSKLLALLLCLCLLLTGAPGIAALAVGDDDEPAENPAESASRLQDLDPATLGVHKLGEIDEQEIIPGSTRATPPRGSAGTVPRPATARPSAPIRRTSRHPSRTRSATHLMSSGT